MCFCKKKKMAAIFDTCLYYNTQIKPTAHGLLTLACCINSDVFKNSNLINKRK